MIELTFDRETAPLVRVFRGDVPHGSRIFLGQVGTSYVCVDQDDTLAFRSGGRFGVTAWDRIELLRPMLTPQTCPRRPVITHSDWPEGCQCYPDIIEHGLRTATDFFSWARIRDDGYIVTGYYESK